MVLIIVTELRDYHHILILEHFQQARKKHVPISSHPPFSPPPATGNHSFTSCLCRWVFYSFDAIVNGIAFYFHFQIVHCYCVDIQLFFLQIDLVSCNLDELVYYSNFLVGSLVFLYITYYLWIRIVLGFPFQPRYLLFLFFLSNY